MLCGDAHMGLYIPDKDEWEELLQRIEELENNQDDEDEEFNIVEEKSSNSNEDESKDESKGIF